MVKEVEFQATLPDVHTAIAISGDGSSKIRLDVPDCDLPEVMKLVLFKGQSFKVTITSED